MTADLKPSALASAGWSARQSSYAERTLALYGPQTTGGRTMGVFHPELSDDELRARLLQKGYPPHVAEVLVAHRDDPDDDAFMATDVEDAA